MADLEGLKVSKEYYIDQPVKTLDQFNSFTSDFRFIHAE